MSDKILKLSLAQTLYQDLRGRIDALPTTTYVDNKAAKFTAHFTMSTADSTITCAETIALIQAAYNAGKCIDGILSVSDETGEDYPTENVSLLFSALSYGDSYFNVIFYSETGVEGLITLLIMGYSDDGVDSWLFGLAAPLTAYIRNNQNDITYNAMGGKITYLADPTANLDAVTKKYVDTLIAGVSVPVLDVLVNGTSILSNGVANISYAGQGVYGITAYNRLYGVEASNGVVSINAANSDSIKEAGNNTAGKHRPIVPYYLHESIFYGLSKLAGVDLANETITLGIYPDSSKAAIQNMLGITDIISTEESSTATAAHTSGSLFMMDGKLMRSTTAITVGDAVVVGTNCEVVKADEVFVKNTDYASSLNAGVVKLNTNSFYINSSGVLLILVGTEAQYKSGASSTVPVAASAQHLSTFFGLSKAAGVDLKNETVTVGTYPLTSRKAICSMIGALGIHNIGSGFSIAEDFVTGEVTFETEVLDVQINGNSIISNGVANIPIGSSSTLGVYKCGAGLAVYGGDTLITNPAGVTSIKTGTSTNGPITPYYIDVATFYGLSRAAGDSTQTASNNAVGVYTSEAQTAIQTMLGTQAAIEVIRL